MSLNVSGEYPSKGNNKCRGSGVKGSCLRVGRMLLWLEIVS